MEKLGDAYLERDWCLVWVSNLEDLLHFRGEGTCFYERILLNPQAERTVEAQLDGIEFYRHGCC
jgi:hypothetical protein